MLFWISTIKRKNKVVFGNEKRVSHTSRSFYELCLLQTFAMRISSRIRFGDGVNTGLTSEKFEQIYDIRTIM